VETAGSDFERYVIEEHVEDFDDRLIDRRELLRRVTLITGSLVTTLALLETLGCGEQPRGSAPSPQGRATSTPQSFATPPAQPVANGVTVPENDRRIKVEQLAVKGTDGAPLLSYAARPASGTPAGGIVVIHENRGLVPHIEDVVRRVATAGFVGLSVDLLSRDGGADRLADPAAYQAALAKRAPADMVSDIRQAVAALPRDAVGDRVGLTGFCFGGGVTWNALAGGLPVKAAVPFYGPPPQNMAGLASTRAAVFAVYAEQDARITGSREQVEAQLKKNGRPYQVQVYPGVDHAFHNDTGQRYNATQAEAAWMATIGWFRQYLK
jgi:carboxymethylenebutenolidase